METVLEDIPLEIVLGDCVQGMKTLVDTQSVDVVVTSPPYNLGKEYSVYDDNKTPHEYKEWCKDWASEVKRVLKPDGSFFLNLGNASDNRFFAFEVAIEMRNLFDLQNTIHWIKSISIERESDVNSYGHFKPINSSRFLNDCHEYLFHFTQEGTTKLDRLAIGVPYADKTNIARWGHTNGRDKRCRGNTWFVPYKTIQQRDKQRPHPATFPTELASKCIRLHGKQNCTVLDPFLGIGHSAFAAKECSDIVSKFIGFDIDEEYIKVACEALHCNYTKISQRNHQTLHLADA
jgi:site-specific DNA-methyltransferase (adenine-specific)